MTRRDLAALGLLGAIWGSSFLFQRLAAPEFGAVPLVFLRVTIAAVLLWTAVMATGCYDGLRQRWRAIALVGLLNSALPFALFAYVTQHLPAGLAAVLNGTVPLFAALLGIIVFRQGLEAEQVIGLLVGFAGLLLFLSDELMGSEALLPIGAGIAASISYAIAAVYIKRRLTEVPPLALAAGSQLAAMLLLMLPALALWPSRLPSDAALRSVWVLGVVCTGGAYVLFYRLVERVGAVNTLAVTYLIPLFGLGWGALFLHEQLTPSRLAGAGVVLLGVALTTGQARLLRVRTVPTLPAERS